MSIKAPFTALVYWNNDPNVIPGNVPDDYTPETCTAFSPCVSMNLQTQGVAELVLANGNVHFVSMANVQLITLSNIPQTTETPTNE